MSRRAQGLRAWLWQRLSAVYLLGYALFVFTALAVSPPESYAAWRAWMSGPMVGLATALFFGALLLHAWVGMRDVIIDYAGVLSLRLALLAVTGLGLAGAGLWVLRTLYSLHSQ
ncbi:MAG: succinate dehydrogenase, hydrophobic membrane anchor protein [Gammaproteobacteria bacterium]|nr:succinate dehydrogenase, hydrophobic membrane anchor protein [Gammaproteobacteria bacterium]